jgi:Domain of unknown function (DUF4386)
MTGPRPNPTVGFVGATLLVAGDIAVLFSVVGQHGAVAVLAIPIALWEFSLGVYLVVKGPLPSPRCITEREALTTIPSSR